MDARPGDYMRNTRTTVDLAESIYTDTPSHAPQTPTKSAQSWVSKPAQPHGGITRITLPQISLHNNRSCFFPTRKSNKPKLHREHMRPNTCLNLDTSLSSSSLWILPDLDEWSMESPSPQQETSLTEAGPWAPLVSRAVSSNRERLRRRLEGDGWDFVGGRYGEEAKTIEEERKLGEESLDEEFDVVVLPAVSASYRTLLSSRI